MAPPEGTRPERSTIQMHGVGPARILTFMIADVRGYTAFTQANGDESAARLARTFAEIAREGVEAHGGEVVELRGDEALAVFTSARDALRAAAELQLTFMDEVARRPELPLRVGVGLDAGEAVPVEGGYRGAALNLAARLCSKAGPGEVLASQGVVHLARTVPGIRIQDGGAFELKGMDVPVPVYRVSSEDADVIRQPPAASGPGEDLPAELDPSSALVGRDPEARWLRWWWRRVRRGAGALVVLEGVPGIGRTRLAADVAALAHSDGALIRFVAPGAPDIRPPDPLNGGANGPALIVLDDLDRAPLDDVNRLARSMELLAGRPVLIVGTVDPAGADRALESILRRAREDGRAVSLGPLNAEAVRQLAALYAGDGSDPPVDSILESTRGMPGRVHRAVAEWARDTATRKLMDAAARTASGWSDLREREEDLARTLVDLQLAKEGLRGFEAPTPAEGPAESPFKGLAAFDVDDADVFFGRERLVAELVARMARAPLLGVIGPSGSGKSSVVRAGLVPALAAGMLPGSEGWARAIFRPGVHPLRELDRAVWGAMPERLRGDLAGTELPLRALRSALAEAERILLVVDQFEEVFTLCADEGERTAFVAALTEAALDSNRRAAVVVAVRADFYGRCAAYPALADLLGANHVLVGSMTDEEHRRAIEQPALRAGLRVDPTLADALVAEVEGEPGGLPLLSTALLELWHRRDGRRMTMAAYVETGGVRGAVARLAEDAYTGLTEGQRNVSRGVMLRLVGPGEGDAVVRRRAPLSEFDAENPDVGRVLEVLTDRRLVTVSEGTVEVAHEALLREWPRLRDWIEEDREGRRLRGHLIDAARGWESAGEDPGELYRGTRLATAIDWTAEHSLELNELERRFLTESRAATESEAVRQRRTNRRLRALLAGTAILLVLALVAGSLALIQRGRARDAAEAAERSATEATAQRLGAQALVQKDLDLTLLLARQGTALDDSVLTRGNLLAALVRSPAAVGVARPLPGRLLSVYADPAGEYLAVNSNSSEAALLDPVSLETIRTMDGLALVVGGTLISVREGGRIEVVDAATGGTRVLFEPPSPDWCTFAVAPDLSTVALGACDGSEITLYDTATDAERIRIPADPGFPFADMWYVPDGHLFTMDNEGPLPENFILDSVRFTLRDPVTGEALTSIPGPDGIAPFGFSPDGATVALGRGDGGVTLHDLRTGKARDLHGRHNADVMAIGYSPDGRTLVSTGDDDVAIVWDVESGENRETLRGHNGRVFGPAFSPDGDTVYTVSLDGSLLAWDLGGKRRLGRPFDAGEGAPTVFDPFPAFDLSPDGRLLAVAQASGVVDILDSADYQVVRTIEVGDPGAVLDVSFSPDGSLLVTSGRGGLVRVWNTSSWAAVGPPLELPDTPEGFDVLATRAVFSPDGHLLAVGLQVIGPPKPDRPSEGASRIVVWDVASGAPLGDPLDLNGSLDVFDVAFSPDGRLLAATMDVFQGPEGDLQGGYARVWSVVDRTERYTVNVDGDYGRAYAVAFSPDGSLLATGGGTGDVRFFDAGTGALRGRSVLASAGWVQSIDFSPDGSTIVTTGTDGTTRLIDVESRAVIGAPLPGEDQVSARARFTPDGAQVIVVPETHEGAAWNVTPDAWNRQACEVAARQLTTDEWKRFLPGLAYDPACPGGF